MADSVDQFISDLGKRLDNQKQVENFVGAFGKMLDVFDQLKVGNEKERQSIQSQINELRQQVGKRLAELKDGKTPTNEELLALIRPLIPQVKDGESPDPEEVAEIVLANLKLPEQKAFLLDPYEIRDKLLSLPEEDRLPASGLKNDRIEPEDQKVTRIVSNHGPLYSLVDVNVTGVTTGQFLKWDGTQWVPGTVSASGITELTATGTVDGNNVTFTFTQVPTYIVADGVFSKVNKGWTNSGTTITMFIPPSNDIYGIA